MIKRFTDPTSFPAPWSFTSGAFRFDILIASAEAWVAMKMNSRQINAAELKALKGQRSEGVTIEDIKSLVGKAFMAPLVNEPDPDVKEAICLTHGGCFQPIQYRVGNGELRGSFTEFKAERLANLPEDARNRNEVAVLLQVTTKLIFGDRVPKNILVAAKCPGCVRAERRGKDKVIVTYLTASQVRDQAAGHDARISAAQRRNYVNSLFGGGGSKREAGGGRSSYDRNRGGNRGQRRSDDRPRASFHGASFLEDTAKAFTKAEESGRLVGGLSQLAEASNDFLKSLGIDGSERAYDAIRTIASRTLEKSERAEIISREAAQAGAKLGDIFPDSVKSLGKKPARRGKKSSSPRMSKADRING